MRDEARYRHLTADEQALLAPAELDAYRDQRLAFDLEVRQLKTAIRRTGRLEVRPGVFLPVPVPMRERAHR